MTEQEVAEFVTRVAAEKDAELALLRGRVRELEAQAATYATIGDGSMAARLAQAEEVARTAQAELEPIRADRTAAAQRLDSTLKLMEQAITDAVGNGAAHGIECDGGDPCSCWVGRYLRIARDL